MFVKVTYARNYKIKRWHLNQIRKMCNRTIILGDPDIVSSLRNGEFTMSFPNTTSSLHSSGHNVAIASVMSQYPRLSINWFKEYHAISKII